MVILPVDPPRRIVLVASVVYVLIHALTVLGVTIGFESNHDLLVSSGAATLLYPVLVTGFGAVLVWATGRSLRRVWYGVGACIIVAIVGVRYLLPAAGSILAITALVTTVSLPFLVLLLISVRLVIVRLPVPRLARVPSSRKTAGVLFVVGALLVAVAGGSVAAAVTAPSAVPPNDWAADRQLAYLAETDQTDRQTGAFLDSSRDYKRASRVLSLLAGDQVDTPAASLDAAIVLQHGTCPAHFELAYRLAATAHAGGADGAIQWRRLTYDRWQLSLGNEQQYGTQSGTVSVDGTCTPEVPQEIVFSEPLNRTTTHTQP